MILRKTRWFYESAMILRKAQWFYERRDDLILEPLLAFQAPFCLPRPNSGFRGPTLVFMTRLWPLTSQALPLTSQALPMTSQALPMTSQALPLTSQVLHLTYQALPLAFTAGLWPPRPTRGFCGPPLASKVHFWVSELHFEPLRPTLSFWGPLRASEAHFEPLRPISGLQGASLASIAHIWPPRPVCGLRALPLAFNDWHPRPTFNISRYVYVVTCLKTWIRSDFLNLLQYAVISCYFKEFFLKSFV